MPEEPLIRRSPIPRCDCNLAKGFELIGDRWSLLILRSALHGLRRFDDFQDELEIPRSVLSSRLAGLVDAGIFERREYREEGQRSRIEYPLTNMGRALALPFIAMTEWADRWVGDGSTPLALKSKSSGQAVRVALVDEDGNLVRANDVETVVSLPKSAKDEASAGKAVRQSDKA